MSPRPITRDIKQHVRTVSPSNSISPSIEGSDTNHEPNHKQQNRSESMHWSVLVPVIGMSIMMWAQKANARVRQHATACYTGDFCVGTDTSGPNIPEEIVFEKSSSNVGTDLYRNHSGDVDGGYDASWTVPHPIRRTKWNEIPLDPVDEVSLKGSSMYLSDGEDEMEALPYNCDDDDDDETHDYRSDIQELQNHWDSMRKMR